MSLVLPLVLSTAPAAVPAIRFAPAEPRIGDVVIVYITSTNRREQSGTLEAFGCKTALDRVSKDLLRGIIGIPSDIEAGGYPLHVTIEDKKTKSRLGVDHRIFEQSELRVSKRFTKKKSAALRARLRREAKEMSDLLDRPPSIPKAVGSVHRPVTGIVTSPFGVRRVFNGKRKSVHYGLDLDGRTGDPIRAALPGRVVMSAMRWASGGTIVLDHGGGLFSSYFHMSRRDRKPGDFAKKGTLLGAVGKTGRVTGPHLHLAVFTRCEREDGSTRSFYVDPERFLTLSFEGDPDYLERAPEKSAPHFGGDANP